MASRKAKELHNRRERRKAKASDWKREPKRKPRKKAHGPS